MIAIEERPSPNHERRRGTDRPDMIILHYTGMPSEEAALDWLCNPRSGVSAHYQVFAGGRIVRMVEEARRAWHAGESFWDGATDLNSRSIGIEITNPGHEYGYVDFATAQIEALIALLDDIRGRRPIPDARILAHSDVAPHRKRDPGERFPWARLAAAGHGIWPDPRLVRDLLAAPGESFARTLDPAVNAAGFHQRLARIGYGITPTGDPSVDDPLLVAAFQRRYRPHAVTGVIDAETLAVLTALEAAFAAAGASPAQPRRQPFEGDTGNDRSNA